MAYMSQEKKKELAPAINAVLKEFGVKGSIAVHNHSSLVVTLSEGVLDIVGNYQKVQNEKNGREICVGGDHSVNPYWIDDNYTGKVKTFLEKLKTAMMNGNHDNSDIMTDYFDVGWYVNIYVGKWNKPYVCNK